VSRYQKCKTNLDFTEARDSEWQWHQLGHMQLRRTPLLLRVCCCGPGGQEISIDFCTAGGQQQPRRSTALSSKCAECRDVSWSRKLNTDLLRLHTTIMRHQIVKHNPYF